MEICVPLMKFQIRENITPFSPEKIKNMHDEQYVLMHENELIMSLEQKTIFFTFICPNQNAEWVGSNFYCNFHKRKCNKILLNLLQGIII